MPNPVLEYSADPDIDPARTLAAINAAVASCAVFDDDDIKTRAAKFDAWLVGSEGRGDGFAHLRFSMGPRDSAIEGALADAAMRAMQETIRTRGGRQAQLCVEILHVVMPPYRKRMAHGG